MFHEVVHSDRGGDDAEGFGIDDEDHPSLGCSTAGGLLLGLLLEDDLLGGLEYIVEEIVLDGFAEGEAGGGGADGGAVGGTAVGGSAGVSGHSGVDRWGY